MIKLEFADYCQNCPDIEVVSKTNITDMDGLLGPEMFVDTYIRCAKYHQCKTLERHIRKELKKEKED